MNVAFQTLLVRMQACRGRVDEYVEPYLQLVLQRLAATPAPSSTLKDLLLNVVADALFYNPELAMKLLQKQGALAATFSTILPKHSSSVMSR